MSKPTVGVGIVGTRFMGRAHSNAYRQARTFFDLPVTPLLQAACGRNESRLTALCAAVWLGTPPHRLPAVGRTRRC